MSALFHRVASRWLCTGALVASLVLAGSALPAQAPREAYDLDVLARIREHGLERSQVAELAAHLTDVIGPRVMGSSNMHRANAWTAERLRGWGLAKVVVEPWGVFGRGWEEVSYSGRMLEPFVQPLSARPLAWSGSTPGTIVGPVVALATMDTSEIRVQRRRLANAFVLWREPPTDADPTAVERPRRYSEAMLRDSVLFPTPLRPPTPEQLDAVARADQRIHAVMRAFEQARIGALLLPSPRPYGLLHVEQTPGFRRVRDSLAVRPTPALVVAREQYAHLWRNVQRGVPTRLEVNAKTRLVRDDIRGYNTLAELPGSDLAHQRVMIGAHLDSYSSGTGATDNAAGVAIVMEAIRILKALALAPRRTIQVGLWSSEEPGPDGSLGWVNRHARELDSISAYLNIDTGTGRIRGIIDQGNAAAGAIFAAIFAPVRDLGVVGVQRGWRGGSDHIRFDFAGVPGFSFIQDPIDYYAVQGTHHTAADTFDHLLIDDLKQAAVIVAWTAFALANRDSMVPRK